MNQLKQDIKIVWKSKCKYLIIIAFALILVNGVNLLQTSFKFLNSNGEEVEEIKSVEIESDDWVNREPGSFHITKSAEWTGYKEATIRFDVDTTKKVETKKDEVIEGVISGADIMLVLDTSGSMESKDRLVHLKEGATQLVDQILSEENHTIALITFNGSATLSSTFTNDKSKLLSQISSLSPGGSTNFIKAYKEVISLLSEYKQSKNRDLVMLFLTDGSAASAKAQYQILKDTYDITIVGIQYDMGSSIKKVFNEMTDKQYLADVNNIKFILSQALSESTDKIQVAELKKAEKYETFEIEDYVSKEFMVKSVDDIQVSKGTVGLKTLEDGTQKILWKITDKEKFATGDSATMSIKAHYQGELNANRVYETNQKESIKTKLPEQTEKMITSGLTPQLRAGYSITYNPNLPSECNPEGRDMTITNSSFAYEEVKFPKNEYSCSSWQFKGWRFPDEVTITGNDGIIMPSDDITATGVWTKMEISKSMEGTISQPIEELRTLMIENAGTVSVDSSIKFSSPSSASNGRGLYIRSGTENDTNPIYYYRGNVNNNNVLFAGICWQIVRTTESGGVKLIYNGVSTDGKSCVNTENSYIGSSTFNSSASSPTYSGYMTGTPFTVSTLTQGFNAYYFGNDITYDSSKGKYQLVTPVKGGPTTGYHYTCKTNVKGGKCSPVRYMYYTTSFETGSTKYFIELSSGKTIEDVITGMNSNSSSSRIKTVIENWYQTNLEDKEYTKYLEDTVWCNDRKFVSSGLMSKDGSYGAPIYGAYTRLTSSASKNPLVKDVDVCPNMNDRFTVNSGTGNKKLTYPVGMLTADEVMLSGIGYGSSSSSTDSYLSTSYHYWTMTPISFIENATNFYVGNGGYLVESSTSTGYNVRPSISLKPGTIVSSNGTLERPYVVVME